MAINGWGSAITWKHVDSSDVRPLRWMCRKPWKDILAAAYRNAKNSLAPNGLCVKQARGTCRERETRQPTSAVRAAIYARVSCEQQAQQSTIGRSCSRNPGKTGPKRWDGPGRLRILSFKASQLRPSC